MLGYTSSAPRAFPSPFRTAGLCCSLQSPTLLLRLVAAIEDDDVNGDELRAQLASPTSKVNRQIWFRSSPPRIYSSLSFRSPLTHLSCILTKSVASRHLEFQLSNLIVRHRVEVSAIAKHCANTADLHKARRPSIRIYEKAMTRPGCVGW